MTPESATRVLAKGERRSRSGDMDDGVAPPAGVDGVLDGARGVDAPGARDTGTGERGGVESAVAPSSSLSTSPSFVNRIPSETEPVLAGSPSSSLSLSLSSSSASSSSSSSASPPSPGAAPPHPG